MFIRRAKSVELSSAFSSASASHTVSLSLTMSSLHIAAILAVLAVIAVWWYREKWETREAFTADSNGPAVRALYFYLPKCPHCVKFDGTWSKFALTAPGTLVNGVKLQLRKVNADSNDDSDPDLAEYVFSGAVQGFPHIRFVSVDARGQVVSDKPFKGPRTVAALQEALNQAAAAATHAS